jgi:periplasmic nitrate reductase NapD
MSGLVHISSLIVHVRPELVETVRQMVLSRGGEIAASDPHGKLVVVIETPDEAGVTGFAEDLAAMKGVLSANLVYHLVDDPEKPGETPKNPGEYSCPPRH